MLYTPFNIAHYCQQKRTGHIQVRASDLANIKAVMHDFSCHYECALENSRHVLQLRFECLLALHCQSCWKTYQQPITVNNRLLLTTDSRQQTEDELSALGYEVVVIDDRHTVSLGQLIEEEIFLQIPHIPRCHAHNHHDQGVSLVIDEHGLSFDEFKKGNRQQPTADQSTTKPPTHQPFQDLLKEMMMKSKK